MNNLMISAKHVTKRYAKSQEFSLKGIDLAIQKGEFFGLLGPNGCGKTTLISILIGLIPPTDGEVEIDGKNIKNKLQEIKPLIGFIPQEIALYQSLTIVDNLKFFGKLYGLQGKNLAEQVESCIKIADLDHARNIPVKNFSGGMKRRANLILGLVHNPQIIFLDEPTANIDPQSRNVIFNILKMLNDKGITLVYTTHHLEEAEQMCSRIAIMDQGMIIAIDTPENLVKNTPNADNLGEVFIKLTGRHVRDSLQ